jgi:hypothetical protein
MTYDAKYENIFLLSTLNAIMVVLIEKYGCLTVPCKVLCYT